MAAKSGSVALENKLETNSNCGSESDGGDEPDKDDQSLAYEKMYAQWLKVCAANRALNSEIHVLHDLNVKAEGKIFELEVLLAEQIENLNSVTTKLEKT